MTFEFTRAETLLLMLALRQYAKDKDNNEKNRTMAMDVLDKILRTVAEDFAEEQKPKKKSLEDLQNEIYESNNWNNIAMR